MVAQRWVRRLQTMVVTWVRRLQTMAAAAITSAAVSGLLVIKSRDSRIVSMVAQYKTGKTITVSEDGKFTEKNPDGTVKSVLDLGQHQETVQQLLFLPNH